MKPGSIVLIVAVTFLAGTGVALALAPEKSTTGAGKPATAAGKSATGAGKSVIGPQKHSIPPRFMHGTVKASSAEGVTVEGKENGKDRQWTFMLDPEARIVRSGKAATARDVEPGDLVTVKYTEQGGKAVAHDVTAQPRPVMTASGTVKSSPAGSLVVASRTGTPIKGWTFVLDSGTRVAKNGKPASATDVKAGDLVTVKYTERDGKAVAQDIAVQQVVKIASGTVKSSSAGSLVVNSRVVTGGAQATTEELTFALDSKTHITKNRKPATATALQAGDSVNVRYTEEEGKDVAQDVSAMGR